MIPCKLVRHGRGCVPVFVCMYMPGNVTKLVRSEEFAKFKILLFIANHRIHTARTLRKRRNSNAANGYEISEYSCAGEEVRYDMTEGARTPKR